MPQDLLGCRVAAVAAVLVGLADAPEARAQAVLTTSVLPLGPEVTTMGAADANATVAFQVGLKLRDKTGLDARLARGERLGAAELGARHLPAPGAYRAVRDWLTGQGLTIDRDSGSRLLIAVHGTAAQVSRALGVSFATVVVEGQSFVAAQQAPTVPAALAPYVESVNGLQPYQHMRRLGLTSRARAAVTFSGNYYPAGILRAYQALPYLTQSGQGTRTAIVIDALPHTSDLTKFWKMAGTPQTLANVELVNVPGGALPAPSGEETLDAEWSSAIGYQSKVRVYAVGSLGFTAIDTGFDAILSDLGQGVAVSQLSISLGACETGISAGQVSTDNNLLESIAAQGVSIFVSSGDAGAYECGGGGRVPAFYSTSPYVTAVGGTHLIATAASNKAAKITIKSETGWSDSGGGVSRVFGQPSYQSSLSYAMRAVPDVAAVADPQTGVVIVLDGYSQEVGGTSVASPVWAGLASLVNQARFAAGLGALGPLNPRIYPLLGTVNFRDITQGNNGYAATTGYDLVTGIGSPVMKQLLPTLAAQP